MQRINSVNQEAVLEDYDAWHHQMSHSAEADNPLLFAWYESVYRELEYYTTPCRVLEVGCGRGGFAIWLADKKPHFHITGMDFSGAAIEIANSHAKTKNSSVIFVQGDAEALPFEDASFDLVISCECMEHVPNPPKMAQEMARVLKPGGRFCLTTENYLNGMMLAWLQAWLKGQAFNSGSGIQPRENFFFFWMVQSYMLNAGLTVDRLESSHHQWLLLPRVDPAKLCTERFRSPLAQKLALPFGRHMSFFGRKEA